MAKKGMRRPSVEDEKDNKDKKDYPKDTVEPVPEIQGKAKLSNKKIQTSPIVGKRNDYIINRKG